MAIRRRTHKENGKPETKGPVFDLDKILDAMATTPSVRASFFDEVSQLHVWLREVKERGGGTQITFVGFFLRFSFSGFPFLTFWVIFFCTFYPSNI